MKNNKLFIMFLLITGLCCSSSVRHRSIYRAVERGDVDIIANKAGLIRTVYCDIYIEHLDRSLQGRITGSDIYKGGGKDFPLEPCFQFIIYNTWNKPITIEKIQIKYNSESYGPEFYDYVKDTAYSDKRFNINLGEVFKTRRLTGEHELINDIDYDNETIEYRTDFIAPGDKILFFRFFRVVPHRSDVKISIFIKYFDTKKIIDFDIGRFDYNDSDNEK